jgi:hypothetical protein
MTRSNDRTIAGDKASHDELNAAPEGFSRSTAIADGSLIPVAETLAKDSRFLVPVALTRSAWIACVEGADGDAEAEEERLWSVLFMALDAIRRKDRKTASAEFIVHRAAEDSTVKTPIHLKIVVSPGDDRKPVLTVLLKSED